MNKVLLIELFVSCICFAGPVMQWSKTTTPQNNLWMQGAYGNGKYVIVSQDGTNRLMYSSDAVNWSNCTTPLQMLLYDVIYGGGKFVAVGYNAQARLLYSSDGITFDTTHGTLAASCRAICYGGGKYVVVRLDGGTYRVMWSSDAITWDTAHAVNGYSWYDVEYGNGKYVAVANDGANPIMYSADALTWTNANHGSADNLYSITFGNNKFVAVANNGSKPMMYSSDTGKTWTEASLHYHGNWVRVLYVGGYFVATSLGSTGKVCYSSDGDKWFQIYGFDANNNRGLFSSDSKLVILASSGTNRINYCTLPFPDDDTVKVDIMAIGCSIGEGVYQYYAPLDTAFNGPTGDYDAQPWVYMRDDLSLSTFYNACVGGKIPEYYLDKIDTLLAKHRPTLVPMVFGTNEIIRDSTTTMLLRNDSILISKIKTFGATPIVCQIPPQNYAFGGSPHHTIKEFNYAIENMAIKNGAGWAVIYDTLANDSDNIVSGFGDPDGAHLLKAGYEAIGRRFAHYTTPSRFSRSIVDTMTEVYYNGKATSMYEIVSSPGKSSYYRDSSANFKKSNATLAWIPCTLYVGANDNYIQFKNVSSITELHNCTLTVSTTAGGAVSPSGAQVDTCGDSLRIIALPASGYVFSHWHVTSNIGILDSLNDTTIVFKTDITSGTATAYFLRTIIDSISPLFGKRNSLLTFYVSNLNDSSSLVIAKINKVPLTLIRWSGGQVKGIIPSWSPKGFYWPIIGYKNGIDTIPYDTASARYRVLIPSIISGGN